MNYRKIIIDILISRDRNVCKVCGKEFTNFAPPELDHIEARSNGGTDSINNLQLVHSICNRRKGNKKLDNDLKKELTSMSMKHPILRLSEVNSLKIDIVKSALNKNNGHMTYTAAELGISRRQLGYFMDKNNMKADGIDCAYCGRELFNRKCLCGRI